MRLLDTVLITASSDRQAEAFRALLARRCSHGLYPGELAFEVVADPRAAGRHRRLDPVGPRPAGAGAGQWRPEEFPRRAAHPADHAGGESRRLPCYAPEGKLFAPLPLPSSALLPPVVLDAQLGLFFEYPCGAARWSSPRATW